MASKSKITNRTVKSSKKSRKLTVFGNNVVNIPSDIALNDKGNTRWTITTKKKGAVVLSFNSSDASHHESAEMLLEDLLASGMQAFKVGENGKQTGRKVTSVSKKDTDLIILPMPQVVGG